MQAITTLVKLGSLEVFEVANKPEHPVYWQDLRQKQIHGPFKNTWAALEDWRGVKPSESDPIGQVILVDFKAKKRVK